jgi:hypothetical protein
MSWARLLLHWLPAIVGCSARLSGTVGSSPNGVVQAKRPRFEPGARLVTIC